MPKPAPVVHFEIGCKDLAKTSVFYKNLLGWEYAPNHPGMPPMAMIANIGEHAEKKTTGIGGHINCLGHPPHQYVTVYALVDDIDATLKQAVALGGTLLIPKQEVPGMGWFGWFKDPEGNALGLWTAMTK